MLFTSTLILSTLALLTNAQTTTTTDAAIQTTTSAAALSTLIPVYPTRVITSIDNYLSSVRAQPKWSSALQALTSAIPSSILSQIENDPTDYLSSVLEGDETPSWVSAVPTSYISYFSSIAAAEASIATRTAEGPAPTNGPRVEVVGAALAVGAAGLALL